MRKRRVSWGQTSQKGVDGKPHCLVNFFLERFEFETRIIQLFRAWNREDAKIRGIELNNRWGNVQILPLWFERKCLTSEAHCILEHDEVLVGSPQFALRELAVGTVTSATKPFGSLSLLCFPSTRCSSRIFTAKEVTDGHAIIWNLFSENDYGSLTKLFFFFTFKVADRDNKKEKAGGNDISRIFNISRVLSYLTK